MFYSTVCVYVSVRSVCEAHSIVVIGVCMCIYLYECVRSAHICVSGGRESGRLGNQQSILEEVMPKLSVHATPVRFSSSFPR